MTNALLCSRCGATLPSHAASVATTCAFCGTTSAPQPKLVERVIERVVVVTAEVDGVASDAVGCPRCAKTMRRVSGGGQDAFACPKCGAAFITNAQIDMFRKRRNDGLVKAVAHVSLVFGPLEPRTAHLSCPLCQNRLRIEEVEGTVNLMHVCEAHGAFFERNALGEFNELHANKRAGDIDEDDLKDMGIKPKGFFDFFKR